MESKEKFTAFNTKAMELTDDALEQIEGGNNKGGKKAKFKKPCPHCGQNTIPSVLGNDGWYCAVCKKKIGTYNGLAKDKEKHPRR